MKKIIIYGIFFMMYALTTFFGLGPVLLADGSNTERLLTFLVVLIAYAITSFLVVKYTRNQNQK